MNPIVGFGLARIAERKSAPDATSGKVSSTNPRDFLARFLEAQSKDTSIPPWYLVIHFHTLIMGVLPKEL